MLRCIKVPQSPFLVSVGRLVVESSYTFKWSRERCYLEAPDGKTIELSVENFVPTLTGNQKTVLVPATPIIRSAIELAVREVLNECVDGCSHVITAGRHELTHLPSDPNCQVCTQGKLKRVQARRKPNSTNVATTFLERVYADCIGPNSVSSARGNKYALVFRDEFTGRAYVHTLRNITSANILRCFKISFPEGKGLPQTVRADGGPEFSKEFSEYCISKGIVREKGLPHVPQTKGRGEVFHGTLNAGTRAMLAGAGVGVKHWDLAMLHWVHNYNYSVQQPLTGVTPAIATKMPVSAILVPFGCHAISMRERVHHTRMSKWDPSSGHGIVVGYAENKGYLVYETTNAGVINSRLRATRNCRVYFDKFPAHRSSDELMYKHFDIESYLDDVESMGVSGESINQEIQYSPDSPESPDIPFTPDVNEFDQNVPGSPDDNLDGDPFREAEIDDLRPRSRAVSPAQSIVQDLDNVPIDVDQIEVEVVDTSEAEELRNLPQAVGDDRRLNRELKRIEIDPGNLFMDLPEQSERLERAAKRNRVKDVISQPIAPRSVEAMSEDPPAGLVQEGGAGPSDPHKRSSQRLANKRDRDAVSDLPPSDGFQSSMFASGIADRWYEDRTSTEQAEDRIREFLFKDDPMQHAFVTKVVTSKDPEWSSKEAREAFVKERKNLEDKEVVNWSSVREWKDVKLDHPDACVVRLHSILGIKNWERPSSEHVYKGRIVGGGHNVQTTTGKKAEKDQLFGTPVPLPNMRTVLSHGIVNDYPIEVADVDGAFLTATLRGPPMFGRIPQELRPPEWTDKYYDPVVKIEKALYGLPRAGFDWYHYFEQILISFGWKPVEGFDSIYTKGKCTLAAYVDDLLMTGPQAELRKRWAEIRTVLKLKEAPKSLEEFLGIKFSLKAVSKYGREFITDQSDYCKMVVKKFLEESGKTFLRPVNTPTVDRSETKYRTVDEALEYVEEETYTPGKYAVTCRQYIGALLWLMRASRPDIAWSVHRLAKQAHRWTKTSDEDLARIMQYLSETADYVLKEFIDVRDRDLLTITGYTDSDWAGDAGTRKSTSGMVIYITGPHGTRSLIEYGAKLQTFVAKSSGEAEIVALSRCLAQCGISIQLLLGALAKYQPELEVYCDAEVAIKAVLAGSSAQMRYIQKTQGIHLAWLRQLVALDDVSLHKIDTDENVADVMTKGLLVVKFSKFRTMLGIISNN